VTAADEREAFIQQLAAELGGAIPISPLSQLIFEAVWRAGWRPPSSKAASRKAASRQKKAAKGRGQQLRVDMAVRRVFVAKFLRDLSEKRRAKPMSTATAQKIIGQLERLNLPRRPPMTVRTIQEDIRFMKKNGNFGI
jgi:hypothetical protein